MRGACDACGRFEVEVRIDLERRLQVCVDTVACVESMYGVVPPDDDDGRPMRGVAMDAERAATWPDDDP